MKAIDWRLEEDQPVVRYRTLTELFGRPRSTSEVREEKRRSDGRWNLDDVHPDMEGAIAKWLAGHPAQRPTPSGLEVPGRASKMVTLSALRVLSFTEA